jgi:hypothetical protein
MTDLGWVCQIKREYFIIVLKLKNFYIDFIIQSYFPYWLVYLPLKGIFLRKRTSFSFDNLFCSIFFHGNICSFQITRNQKIRQRSISSLYIPFQFPPNSILSVFKFIYFFLHKIKRVKENRQFTNTDANTGIHGLKEKRINGHFSSWRVGKNWLILCWVFVTKHCISRVKWTLFKYW